MPSEVSIGGSRHQGFVLNVSRGGLYVQTSAGAEVGSVVEVELAPPAPARSIPLKARVVWRRVPPARAYGVNEGGVGLCIQSAPASYDELLDELLPPPECPAAAAAPAALRFQVRLRLAGSQRSRTLLVDADSEEGARARAVAQVGGGWTILELRPSAAGREKSGSRSMG
jgi:hypothetical protein